MTGDAVWRADVRRCLWSLGGALVFGLVLVGNSAGYRYGVGDQAGHLPAVLLQLRPELFAEDAWVIAAQSRLSQFDELTAWLVEASGLELPAVAFGLYLASVALLYTGVLAIGRAAGFSSLALVAFACLVTLRHRIPQTSVNSFEGYMHPRILAFGLGTVAVAVLWRRRVGAALGLAGLAALVHPITGAWFMLWVGGAAMLAYPRRRRWLGLLALAGVAGGVWAIAWGPLRQPAPWMDEAWIGVLAGKDYLFPEEWPLAAWLLNGGLLVLVVSIALVRRIRVGLQPVEWGLTAMLVALVAAFVLTLPLVASRHALAVQLQLSRVFWLVDFWAAFLLAWLFTDRRGGGAHRAWSRRAVVLALAALAVGRAGFIMGVERPERPWVRVGLEPSAWHDAMAWLAGTDPDTQVLADPGHAWRYGSSVRVSGQRDVFLEEVKDTAIAMYSRDVAVRVARRIQALGDFDRLSPQRIEALTREYGLDYLVSRHRLDLPVAYRNEEFAVYDLRSLATTR